MTGTSRLLLAGAACTVVMLVSNPAAHAEISPMSRERLPEAEQFGRDAVRNQIPILYIDACRSRSPKGLHLFDVTITTPFTAIANLASDSVKDGKPSDVVHWPLDARWNGSVIVAVDPAGLRGGTPASVAKVVLRRGVQLIEPTHSDSHQVKFPTAEENHREYRGGTFSFPIEAFASGKGDLEIVVFPETDEDGVEAVVTLRKSLLSKLR